MHYKNNHFKTSNLVLLDELWFLYIQSTKILLVPQKSSKFFMHCQFTNYFTMAIPILDFSLLLLIKLLLFQLCDSKICRS